MGGSWKYAWGWFEYVGIRLGAVLIDSIRNYVQCSVPCQG